MERHVDLARGRPGRAPDAVTAVTSAALAGLALLHVGWGLGRSLPGMDAAALTDVVVGSDRRPPPSACFAVAAALGTASAAVAGFPRRTPRLTRLARTGVAAVLGVRGVLGLAGRTDLVSPGSTSPRFRRADRRLYSPICLALATGAARAARAEARVTDLAVPRS